MGSTYSQEDHGPEDESIKRVGRWEVGSTLHSCEAEGGCRRSLHRLTQQVPGSDSGVLGCVVAYSGACGFNNVLRKDQDNKNSVTLLLNSFQWEALEVYQLTVFVLLSCLST